MEDQGLVPRRALLDRLGFIEFRLLWEGKVNRRDLMEVFGISEPQASLDLRRYHELNPSAATYDPSRKAYVRSPDFRPQQLPEDPAEHYLNQLLVLGIAETVAGASWLGGAPPIDVLPRRRKRIPTQVLQAVLTAIRDHQLLDVQYQSLSTVESEQRLIGPHALVHDGFRWHARAWCAKNEDFRDFVLSRVITASETSHPAVAQKDDMEWQTYVTLRIAPHPGLKPHQKRAIELDYNMSSEIALITTRACLYRYLEWIMRLEQPEDVMPRWSGETVLRNRQEVEERCRLAKELTEQRKLARR